MGQRLEPNAPLPGHHVVEALIARGPVCDVYRIRAEDGAVRVARVLPAERLATHGAWFREASDARLLLVHPNLPRTFLNATFDNGELLEVTELLTGRTLRQSLQRSPRGLLVAEVERVAGALGDVIDLLHRQSPPRSHRALVPERVFVRARDNGVRLLDLGVADRPSPPATTTASAPPADLPGDVQDRFMLASLVYELLTATLPFPKGAPAGGDAKGTVPTVRGKRPELTAAVDELLRDTWSCELGRMPATGRAFAARLHSALTGEEPVEQVDERPTREVMVPTVERRKPTLIGTGVTGKQRALAPTPPSASSALRGTTVGAPPGTRPAGEATPPSIDVSALPPPAVVQPSETPSPLRGPTQRDDTTDPSVHAPPDLPFRGNTLVNAPAIRRIEQVEATTEDPLPTVESPAGIEPQGSADQAAGWRSIDEAAATQRVQEPAKPVAPIEPVAKPEPPPTATLPFEPAVPEPEPVAALPPPEPVPDEPSIVAADPTPAPPSPSPRGPIRLAPADIIASEGKPFVPPQPPVSEAFLEEPPTQQPGRRNRSREVTQLLPTLPQETPWHRSSAFLGGLLVAVAVLIVGLAHAVSYGTAVRVAAEQRAQPAVCPPCPVCTAPTLAAAPAVALPTPAPTAPAAPERPAPEPPPAPVVAAPLAAPPPEPAAPPPAAAPPVIQTVAAQQAAPRPRRRRNTGIISSAPF